MNTDYIIYLGEHGELRWRPRLSKRDDSGIPDWLLQDNETYFREKTIELWTMCRRRQGPAYLADQRDQGGFATEAGKRVHALLEEAATVNQQK